MPARPNHGTMPASTTRSAERVQFGEYLGEDKKTYTDEDRSVVGKLVDASARETAGTSVGQMEEDIVSVLGYKIVKAEYFWYEDVVLDSKYPNRFVKKGLPEMIKRLPEKYDPEENTICGILIAMSRTGSGESLKSQVKDSEDNDESLRSRLRKLPQAIHWNRILTKPKSSSNGYTFELFEHGNKREATWSEDVLNQKVYGYVIAERRSEQPSVSPLNRVELAPEPARKLKPYE